MNSKQNLCAAVLTALALTGCSPNRTPEASAAAGINYQVDRLFVHDGCTVYRFVDEHRNRYFTRCDSAVSSEASWSDSYQCGKSQCEDPMSVPTTRSKGLL